MIVLTDTGAAGAKKFGYSGLQYKVAQRQGITLEQANRRNLSINAIDPTTPGLAGESGSCWLTSSEFRPPELRAKLESGGSCYNSRIRRRVRELLAQMRQ